LKQQADASFVLEFHKDEKRMEAKGAIFLDSAVDVCKVSIYLQFVYFFQIQLCLVSLSHFC